MRQVPAKLPRSTQSTMYKAEREVSVKLKTKLSKVARMLCRKTLCVANAIGYKHNSLSQVLIYDATVPSACIKQSRTIQQVPLQIPLFTRT